MTTKQNSNVEDTQNKNTDLQSSSVLANNVNQDKQVNQGKQKVIEGTVGKSNRSKLSKQVAGASVISALQRSQLRKKERRNVKKHHQEAIDYDLDDVSLPSLGLSQTNSQNTKVLDKPQETNKQIKLESEFSSKLNTKALLTNKISNSSNHSLNYNSLDTNKPAVRGFQAYLENVLESQNEANFNDNKLKNSKESFLGTNNKNKIASLELTTTPKTSSTAEKSIKDLRQEDLRQEDSRQEQDKKISVKQLTINQNAVDDLVLDMHFTQGVIKSSEQTASKDNLLNDSNQELNPKLSQELEKLKKISAEEISQPHLQKTSDNKALDNKVLDNENLDNENLDNKISETNISNSKINFSSSKQQKIFAQAVDKKHKSSRAFASVFNQIQEQQNCQADNACLNFNLLSSVVQIDNQDDLQVQVSSLTSDLANAINPQINSQDSNVIATNLLPNDLVKVSNMDVITSTIADISLHEQVKSNEFLLDANNLVIDDKSLSTIVNTKTNNKVNTNQDSFQDQIKITEDDLTSLVIKGISHKGISHDFTAGQNIDREGINDIAVLGSTVIVNNSIGSNPISNNPINNLVDHISIGATEQINTNNRLAQASALKSSQDYEQDYEQDINHNNYEASFDQAKTIFTFIPHSRKHHSQKQIDLELDFDVPIAQRNDLEINKPVNNDEEPIVVTTTQIKEDELSQISPYRSIAKRAIYQEDDDLFLPIDAFSVDLDEDGIPISTDSQESLPTIVPIVAHSKDRRVKIQENTSDLTIDHTQSQFEEITKELEQQSPITPIVAQVAVENSISRSKLQSIVQATEKYDNNEFSLQDDEHINDEAIAQSFIDERRLKLEYLRKIRRHPVFYTTKIILNITSWINPALSVLLGTVLSIRSTANINFVALYAVLLTIILVQVFSNLCKEYSRERGVQSKYEFRLIDNEIISRVQVFRYARLTLFFMVLAGAGLIYVAELSLGESLVFSGLGLLTIIMLMRYYVGDNPYSYSIKGEFVYFFVYGFLIVAGSFFLQIKSIQQFIYIPASASGFLCLGCLNTVNMRDSYVSIAYQKENFATYLGFKASRLIQTCLYLLALIMYWFYNLVQQAPLYCYAFFIAVPLILYHLYIIHSKMQTKELNKQVTITLLINILVTGMFSLTHFIWLGLGPGFGQ